MVLKVQMMEIFPKDISKEQIRELPLIRFEGPIYVIDREEKVLWAVNQLKTYSHLGFDTETKPSFKRGKRNNLSLIQLATDDAAYLFRVNIIGLPDELIEIFENEQIKKIGFDVKSDLHQLRRLRQFEPQGFIDLLTLSKQFGLKDMSLRKLTAILFGKRLSKSQRLSNWDSRNLTEGQLLYAATDAWIALKIYREFLRLMHQ